MSTMLKLGDLQFSSRLLMGTGKFSDVETMISAVQGLDWCEIDNRSDLSRAEEILGLWEDNRGIAGSPLISGGAA